MAPYAFLGALSHIQLEDGSTHAAIEEALKFYDILDEADIKLIVSSATIADRIDQLKEDLENLPLSEEDRKLVHQIILFLKSQ